MSLENSPHHRRSIRLDGYDYTQTGAYFVTLVTHQRANRFGTVENGEMHLNPVGQMILREWNRLPDRFGIIETGAFVIMPNHIHGILVLYAASGGDGDPGVGVGDDPCADGGENGSPIPHVDPGSLGAVIRAYKSSTTLRYHRMRDGGPDALWQRNYYEHIVRSQADLERICAYILANPTQWESDQANPNRKSR